MTGPLPKVDIPEIEMESGDGLPPGWTLTSAWVKRKLDDGNWNYTMQFQMTGPDGHTSTTATSWVSYD